jgi:hypothetical protein
MKKIWIIFEQRETPTPKSKYWSTQVKGPFMPLEFPLDRLGIPALDEARSNLRKAQKAGDVRKIRIVREI